MTMAVFPRVRSSFAACEPEAAFRVGLRRGDHEHRVARQWLTEHLVEYLDFPMSLGPTGPRVVLVDTVTPFGASSRSSRERPSLLRAAHPAEPGAVEAGEGALLLLFPELEQVSDEEVDQAIDEARKKR